MTNWNKNSPQQGRRASLNITTIHSNLQLFATLDNQTLAAERKAANSIYITACNQKIVQWQLKDETKVVVLNIQSEYQNESFE